MAQGAGEMEMVKLVKTWKARELFNEYVKNNQCYDGQISTTVQKFRRELMIPILNMIKELEKKADE